MRLVVVEEVAGHLFLWFSTGERRELTLRTLVYAEA